jgi:tRNA A37 threonylcarbamoyladenosine dehydratase
VLVCDLVSPLFDSICLDLDGQTALATNQVMVVGCGACSVQNFAILGLKRIGITVCCQICKCSINRGQANGRTVVSKHKVQLLGANKSSGFAQCMPHGIFLPGVSAL